MHSQLLLAAERVRSFTLFSSIVVARPTTLNFSQPGFTPSVLRFSLTLMYLSSPFTDFSITNPIESVPSCLSYLSLTFFNFFTISLFLFFL